MNVGRKKKKTSKEINSFQHIRIQTLVMGYNKAEVRRVPIIDD